MNDPQPSSETGTPSPQLVTYTHIIYALHALAVLMGITTGAFIATQFVAGLPSIVAVIMNYARRSEARGSYLESHFRWQIRTFWFAFAGVVAMSLLLITIVLIPFAWIGFMAIGVWIAYRVIRGWLALRDGRPMYV
ncbi:MAG: hypothetical protein WCE48_05795 [Steroidobacteraceae bacterium]